MGQCFYDGDDDDDDNDDEPQIIGVTHEANTSKFRWVGNLA